MKTLIRYFITTLQSAIEPLSYIRVVLLCWICTAQGAIAAADSDTPEQSLLTEQGGYRITVRPQAGTVPVAKMHDWILHVETTSGEVFIPTQLVMLAGMPAHGHGLPSQPRITKYLENGDFLVEGVKFNMTGLWHIVVNVTGPTGPDQVLFELNLRHAPVEVAGAPEGWSNDELRTLNALWINTLEKPAKDVSNRLSSNPDAIRLGRALFFDRKLSAPGMISCANCHDPRKYFTDGKTLSFGSSQTARHSPSLIGAAYSQWFYWDGRRDSLWAQGVTPIEMPGEMDNTRVDAVRYVVTHKEYGPSFSELSDALDKSDVKVMNRFPAGAGPYASSAGKQKWQQMSITDKHAVSQAFADIGKILAAYVETLHHKASRFDRFVEELLGGRQKAANDVLTEDERQGLKLFLDLDRVPCLRCHNGPLFSNQEFHNVATGLAADGAFDFGRYIGLQAAMVNEFNCRGQFSDATPEQCDRLKHVTEGHVDQGAFKVPSLRNVAVTAPYMHDGRFSSLQQVINHYREAPDNSERMHEIPSFELTDKEASQIGVFLGTLTSNNPSDFEYQNRK